LLPVPEKNPAIIISLHIYQINISMDTKTQTQLLMLKSNLAELQMAYNQEPSAELLSNIFQLQVAVQALEQNQSAE
jgi:hypothetical protein